MEAESALEEAEVRYKKAERAEQDGYDAFYNE